MRKPRTQRKEQQAHAARQVAVETLRRQLMSNPNFPVATNAESIFAAATVPEEIVAVPSLNTSVLVRGMTVSESADVTQKSTKINKDGSIGIDFEKQRIWRILYSVKNPENGKPLFKPEEHMFRLKNMPAAAWEPVEKVIRKFAGELDEDAADGGLIGSDAEAVFRE